MHSVDRKYNVLVKVCMLWYAELTNTYVHFAFDGGLMEGSEVPVVSGVRVTAVG